MKESISDGCIHFNENKSEHLVLPYENENMFGLFKKKSEKEKLEAQYDALIKKSYELSHSNRAESDKVQAQAQEVLKKIEALED